ncbi:MAG: hypothetical protein K9J16_13185 [Melioribacteraceae bacterium]|nr:hypothetical protein [Melioribacteraceae bacterium]MCF8353150.1 hypothetical protein [Melioribacteraceae bacterium]MCF8393150.1 hypothetical protein [Melioribacteraceae bacterium]MCF8418053.1 hypothetical protein [Melioribacteraceae bacterium]
MKKTFTYSTLLILLILPPKFFPQETTLDWALHDVGNVRQLVTNMGALWRASTSYPGLIYSEYPRNSFEEHVGEGGIWVGAISGRDTLVSVTTGWAPAFEFFPTAEPWDTIWAVNRGDTVDIPYWSNYVGISDQDLVTKYSDYNVTNIVNHNPLYVDVIQQSFAWGSNPVDNFIVFNFKVIATENNLKDVWIAYWLDGNVGYRGEGWSFALDDYSVYYRDKKLGVAIDAPGGADKTAISPMGVRVFPPKNVDEDSLKWTFNWYPGQGLGSPASEDRDRYLEMSTGEIMENQDPSFAIGSQFIVAFGGVDLAVGDTLEFSVGAVFGEGIEGMMENLEYMEWLVGQDFRVPSPPPPPPLRVETRNKEISLKWDAQPGDIDPETYKDPYRADSVDQPFEGYRVYKSTQGASGPWTLLAEYDVVNNIGYNDGLQHEYIDRGLLNNIEYYYAVTAFSKEDTVLNFPSQESSIFKSSREIIPGTEPPSTVGQVAVVPNPYRGDIAYHTYNPPWERPDQTRDIWMEQDRRIQFINLPQNCEIKVYTLAGDLVETLYHNDANRGYEDWNLTSRVGQAISSGIYLFTVEDKLNGNVQVGKFVVIK